MSTEEPLASSPARLAELFQLHREGLAGAVRGVIGVDRDPREVLQDAFLRAWRALRRGTVPRDPVGWVFVVTLNQAKDLRRRGARERPSTPLHEVPDMQLRDHDPAPPARLEADEALEHARTAITRLTDDEREVFLLRTSAELSFEATAAALSIPVGTAKTRMRAALAKLRRELAAFGPRDGSHAEEPQP